MARIAFIGLGVMGAAMAGHLARAGHGVTVFNRTRATTQLWLEGNAGTAADSPRAAAFGADAVFTCVGADDSLRAVMLGNDGALAAMRSGALYVDHTTASADIAVELAELAAAGGVLALDAPVSGGQAGAESGTLTVMAGGSAEAFAAAEPLLAAYARRVGHLGPAGSGQRAKMVNQIAIAGVLAGLSEALRFAEAAGLDGNAVVEVISKGAAQSWQMDNRAGTMLAGKFDFGFAVDWMRKDLGLALAEARRLGVALPATALVDQFYAEVQAMGGGRDDTSSLIRRVRGA